MYADKITDSMQQTIDETNRRRTLQLAYNEEHGITPQAIIKARNRIIGLDTDDSYRNSSNTPIPYQNEYTHKANIAADTVIKYMNRNELEQTILKMKEEMIESAKNMEFIEAARLRDEILKLEKQLQDK